MSVINAGKIDAKLRKDYGKNSASGTKTQIVDKLYAEYKDQLNRPELTVSNLITAMRYIKKHNVAQKNYGKVLKKIHLVKSSALSRSDFAKLYDKITKDNGTGVSYPEARKVITRYLTFIYNNVHDGNKVRLGQLGQICLQHSNGRHYNNKFGHGKTAPHYYPSFHASAEFKRDVK